VGPVVNLRQPEVAHQSRGLCAADRPLDEEIASVGTPIDLAVIPVPANQLKRLPRVNHSELYGFATSLLPF